MDHDLLLVALDRPLNLACPVHDRLAALVEAVRTVDVDIQKTALLQERKSDVEVVQDHVGLWAAGQILNSVVDGEAVLAELRGDLAGELEMLAVKRDLLHPAPGAQDVLV